MKLNEFETVIKKNELKILGIINEILYNLNIKIGFGFLIREKCRFFKKKFAVYLYLKFLHFSSSF